MKRKLLILSILTLLAILIVPSTALAANNFDSGTGTLTVDTDMTGSLQNEINNLVFSRPDLVRTLNIIAGEVTDSDVNYIHSSLSALKVLNISGNAYFTPENLADGPTGAAVMPAFGFHMMYGGYFSKLESLTIDTTNSSIAFGDSAFNPGTGNPHALTSVYIGNVATFGNQAFAGQADLITVNMPKVITFGMQAFIYCDSLQSITLPMVERFGDLSFGYSMLTTPTSVSLPEATILGDKMFFGCTNLTSISLPKATTFGTSAFRNCTNLATVSLPKVTTLGNDAFICTGVGTAGTNDVLKTISLPELVSTGSGFLIGYTALETVSIPKATTLGNDIFWNLLYKTTKQGVELELGSTVPTNASVAFNYYKTAATKGTLTIPSTAEATYKAYNDGNTGDNYWCGFTLPIYYTIVYRDTDKTSGSAPTDSNKYKSGQTVTVLGNTGNLVRTGYTFGGWSYNSSTYSAGDTVTVGSRSIPFEPKWNPISYKVRFNGNGSDGGTMSDQGFLYGTSKNLTSNAFTKTGYTFDGWATSSTGSKVYNDRQQLSNLTSTTDDVVMLYAKWVANCTITFEENGGSSVTDITQQYGTTIDTQPISTKDDYILEGWYTESSFTNKVTFPYTITGDAILYAKWTTTCTITFNANDGSDTPATATQVYYEQEQKALRKNTFTRTGYSFLGWSTLSTSSTAEHTDEKVLMNAYTENISVTFYAVWEANPFTIYYNSNGGEGTVADQAVKYDETITLNDGSSLSRDGYLLEGWSDGGDVYLLSGLYTVQGDVVLNAVWEVDTDGDGVSDDDEVAAGTNPITATDEPQLGTIEVTILDDDGSALVGYTVVLNSTPQIRTTDLNGKVMFENVSLAPHTLTLRDGNTRLGEYTLNFTQGHDNETTIDDSASTDSTGQIDTVVTSSFLQLQVDIQKNLSNQWQIGNVNFSVEEPIKWSPTTNRVENPMTGDNRFNYIWIFALVLVVLVSSISVVYIKRKH